MSQRSRREIKAPAEFVPNPDWSGPPPRRKGKAKAKNPYEGIDKREICWNMENEGYCPYGAKCWYRHEDDGEIAEQLVKAKRKQFKAPKKTGTQICTWYQGPTGCKFGDKCSNIHVDPPAAEQGPSQWHLQGFYDQYPEHASHAKTNTDRQDDPNEKRWAPDGGCYNKAQFFTEFGGYEEWNWAAGNRCDHGYYGGVKLRKRKSGKRKSRKRKSGKRKSRKRKSGKRKSRKYN